jgi:hypothetical protein
MVSPGGSPVNARRANPRRAALIGSTTTIVAAAAAYFKADQLLSGD